MRSHQGSLTRTCRILRRQKRDARWRWKCRLCSESASPRILRTSLLFWLQMRRAGSRERASQSTVGRNSKIYGIYLAKEEFDEDNRGEQQEACLGSVRHAVQ